MGSDCKTKAERREYYLRNREHQIAYSKAYNKRHKETRKHYQKKRLKKGYFAIKAAQKCEKCGFSHPAALHLHHDRDKIRTLSSMKFSKLSKLEEEIAKGRWLCANCHAIEHYEKGDMGKHKNGSQASPEINGANFELGLFLCQS